MDIEEYPNVCICGVNSKAEMFLDYQYNCITDAEGNPLCENREQTTEEEPEWKHWLNDGPHLRGAEDPVPKGAKQACSGSCLDPEDCDIGSDCLCASDKGVCFTNALTDWIDPAYLDLFCLSPCDSACLLAMMTEKIALLFMCCPPIEH